MKTEINAKGLTAPEIQELIDDEVVQRKFSTIELLEQVESAHQKLMTLIGKKD